jgi:hypothetical protein
MDSVEGKSNKTGIRWKGDGVEWSGLKLEALITSNDPSKYCRTQFQCQICATGASEASRKNRFYAQLVCKGKPFVKPKNFLGQGVVGLDIGPSTMPSSPIPRQTSRVCLELEFNARTIRRLQRKMDRSRRYQPRQFNPTYSTKKEDKWNSSLNYLRFATGKLIWNANWQLIEGVCTVSW